MLLHALMAALSFLPYIQVFFGVITLMLSLFLYLAVSDISAWRDTMLHVFHGCSYFTLERVFMVSWTHHIDLGIVAVVLCIGVIFINGLSVFPATSLSRGQQEVSIPVCQRSLHCATTASCRVQRLRWRLCFKLIVAFLVRRLAQ